MRHTVLSIVLACLACPAHGADLTWSNIGPGGGSDLHFLAVHPGDADVIYVSGDIEGIFKTTDGGLSWRNINGNLAHENYGGDVYFTNDIVLDPADPDRIYLPTAVGLFVSREGGESWELLYPDAIVTEDDPVSVATAAVDPSNSDRLYAGLGNGADGSEADFAEWEPLDGPGGLLLSMDAGTTWETVDVGMPDGTGVHSIVVDPEDPQTIVLATTAGIYRTTDGGASWQSGNSGLPHTNCHRLAARNLDDGSLDLVLTLKVIGDPANGATHSGGLYRSADGGASWADITGDLPRHDDFSELFYDYWQLDVHPTDPDVIYTATVRGSGYEDTGIFATRDGGQTWDHLYTPTDDGWFTPPWGSDPYAFDIAVAPGRPERVVISGDRVDLTDDGGVTWEQRHTQPVDGAWKGTGLELMNTDGLALDPNDDTAYYVGYDDMGLFRTDDGESYARLDPSQDPAIGTVAGDGVKDILVDPDNGDLYISRWQGSQGGYDANYATGGVVFSGDRGATVTDRSSGLPAGRADIVLVPDTGSPGQRTLLAAVYHHGVYRSADSGASWSALNEGLGSGASAAWELAVDPSDPQRVYLGLNNRGAGSPGLYRSSDGGDTWSTVDTYPAGDVLYVGISDHGVLYASVTDNFDWSTTGGLYRSEDNGETWGQIHDHPRIKDLDIHTDNPDRLLVTGQDWYRPAGHGGQLYLSEDGGETWDVISAGVAHTFFNFARFDARRSPTVVLAGTAGGGLWSAALEGGTTSPVLPGDFDGSGKVDFTDFLSFASAFGTASPEHDLNDSGAVDFEDFLIFAGNFGKTSD